MTATLAEVVQRCAELSIRGTLDTVRQFHVEYAARIAGLRTRITTSASAVPATSLKVTKVTSPAEQMIICLHMAINSAECSVAFAEDLIKGTTDAYRTAVADLPQTLMTVLQSSGATAPSSAATQAMVCPRVDAALRQRLASLVAGLARTKPSLDDRLQTVEEQIQKLEAVTQTIRNLRLA